MNFNKVMFSSVTDQWSTPKDVIESLIKEFGDLADPCPYNASPSFDGLSMEWSYSRVNFVNPPYSDIKNWCKKSYEEWQKGKTVVMLIPSRTDTKYWHDYIMKATEIRFIKGRLKFGDSKNSAPFPSCLVIFKGETK